MRLASCDALRRWLSNQTDRLGEVHGTFSPQKEPHAEISTGRKLGRRQEEARLVTKDRTGRVESTLARAYVKP